MAIRDRFEAIFGAREVRPVIRPEVPESHRRTVGRPGGYIPATQREAPDYVSPAAGPWHHVTHDEDFSVGYISQSAGGPRQPSADWGDNEDFKDDNVPWLIRPSSTSNPSRPRTRALGYNAETGVLRIEFRDGPVYDYDNVTPEQWEQLSHAWSPGKWINRNLDGGDYTRLA